MVSNRLVKKSADSDSVSDSWRKQYKLIYTGRRRAQRLSNGVRQMQCGDDAPLRRSFLASKMQRNHRPTCHVPDTPRTHPCTWASDAPSAAMQATAHRRRMLAAQAKTTCHPPWGSNIQYLMACIESCNSNCNFNYNLFNRRPTHEFFIPYIDRCH